MWCSKQGFGRRKWLKAAGAALLLPLSPVALAGGPTVRAAKIVQTGDVTRLIVDCDGEVAATYFMVANPNRLVVDLDGLPRIYDPLRQLVDLVRPEDDLVAGVRIGVNRPGVVRVVLELKRLATANLAMSGPRIMIELRGAEEMDLLMQAASGRLSGAPREQGATQAKVGREEPMESDGVPEGAGRRVTVMIDPGHGGEDPGAIGPSGLREKDVNLAVAKELKSLIDAQPGMRAVLTRSTDVFVPLAERVQRARRIRADLFLSIHADAWVNSEARGASVFVLSERGASSAQARLLAQHENSVDILGGIKVSPTKDAFLRRTLIDLSQTATMRDSQKLGRLILSELEPLSKLHKSRVEEAGFAVLKAPDIPSALIETAFISNPEEEALLADPAYRRRLSEAVVRGVRQYFAKSLPSSQRVAA